MKEKEMTCNQKGATSGLGLRVGLVLERSNAF